MFMNVLYIIHIKSNIHLMFFSQVFSIIFWCPLRQVWSPWRCWAGKTIWRFPAAWLLQRCGDAFWVEMEVSRFPFRHGGPTVLINFPWDFPWNKASSDKGSSPIYGKPHMMGWIWHMDFVDLKMGETWNNASNLWQLVWGKRGFQASNFGLSYFQTNPQGDVVGCQPTRNAHSETSKALCIRHYNKRL